MSVYALKAVTTLGTFAQTGSRVLLPTLRNTIGAFQPVRLRRAKHWNPKFKNLRKQKVIKIELPNFHEKMTEELARSKMKEKGLLPPRPWIERPVYISCSGSIIEEYVPPEGDGKYSALSKAGAKQTAEFLTKKSKTMVAVRKIKGYDQDFNVKEFPEQAQEIYLKAHEALMSKDHLLLQAMVTERAYPLMMHNVKDKTIRWKFLESLEPPRVVAVKCANLVTNDNYFGQVTVRFHTQQTLAIYDRFGRLMSGSEIVRKDVLEYVVFEKHITYEYGTWRLHGKILPAWAPPREWGERTFIEKPKEAKPEEKEVVSTTAATAEPSVLEKELPEIKAQPVV